MMHAETADLSDRIVTLRDGSTVELQLLDPSEIEALQQFFTEAVSPKSLELFFGTAPSQEMLRRYLKDLLTAMQSGDATVLVARGGYPQRILGFAVLHYQPRGAATVRFLVADALQGLGIGTHLIAAIAGLANKAGIDILSSIVSPENHAMLQIVRDAGFPLNVDIREGHLVATFPTQRTPAMIERFERREQIAAINALKHFLEPRSIAVIGASRNRDTISGKIFYNLLNYGFEGPVYPVNPSAKVVQSVPAYPSIEAIPDAVELAFIVVPAPFVTEVAKQCARKGVKALVVISAGFAEVGGEGVERQKALLQICRDSGMRLIGPNCMGIANTDPAIRLHGTFVPTPPPSGRIGFLSQSGALGVAVMEYAQMLDLGIASFVSVGNKADISGNDLLQYWENDPRTDVILLYLESFGNPRKFSRIARRVARKKPIIAVKSGRSPAGSRATSSHTGALLEASDATVDALFHQTGVIRTDTLEQMFDVAAILLHQPLPTGNRVAIITNGGGPAILCADACEAEGLVVPELSADTQQQLRDFLPPEAGLLNPVDMIASATAQDYERAILQVARDPGIDSIITIFIPPLLVQPEEAAQAMVRAVRQLRQEGNQKPVVAVFMLSRGAPSQLRAEDVQIPAFTFPEDAAIALARVTRYALWRQKPEEPPYRPENVDPHIPRVTIAQALKAGKQWLSPQECRTVLESYGIPVVPEILVAADQPERLPEAARQLGYPVVLKAVAPKLIHKSDVGGVVTNIQSEQALLDAAEQMQHRLAQRGLSLDGFLLQPMLSDGVEMLVGIVHDSHFGPIIAVAAGGVLVELLNDVALRLTPLSRQDASEMLRELKTFPLLNGYRGRPKVNIAALEQILLSLSALVEDIPQIQELDCNPIIVTPESAIVVDSRIRIFDPAQWREPLLKR